MMNRFCFLIFGAIAFAVPAASAGDAKKESAPPARAGFITKDAVVVSRPSRDGVPAQFRVSSDLRTVAVEVKTDKTAYTEGEEIAITVEAAESGHLRLLYQNAAGEIYTLFPNQFITDDRITGGRSVKVMPTANPKKPGDEVAIQVAGPNFGTEFLAAIVSSEPFSNEAALRDQCKEAIFPKSTASTLVAVITKDAKVISRASRADTGSTAAAGFAKVTLTTRPK